MMAGSLIGLGVSFFYLDESRFAKGFGVAFIFLFSIIFELSLGPIPWLFMAEIMTPKGMSVAILLSWLSTLAISIVTPFLISGELFLVFGGVCVFVRLFSNSELLVRVLFKIFIKGN